MKPQTVLITGTSGFVGKHLTQYLKQYPDLYSVIAPPSNILNLRDQISINKFIKGYKIDGVVHLAAKSSPSMDGDVEEFLDTNVVGTARLIQALDIGTRFIYASSIVVGGTSHIKYCNNYQHIPTNLYSASKAAAEDIVTAYTNLKKINGLSLRFCATVGEGLTHGCVLDFIKKLHSDNPVISLMGNYPGSKKPYLYIDDVCESIHLGLQEKDVLGSLNITNNDSITIDDIVDTVMSYYGITKEKEWTGINFPGDNPSLEYENYLTKLCLRWEPSLSSKEAILQTLKDITHKTQQTS
jgi:nucleoside-diphosphate-sugar epimerase